MINNQIQEKNSAVLNELFDKHYPNLLLFAKRIIGNTEDAKDIVGESFIKFLSKENIFSNETHVKVYIYTIIKNQSVDYLRRGKIKNKFIECMEAKLKQSEPFENLIEIKFQEAELIQILYDRVNQLPDRMQQVFKLTYLDGFSRAEIAQMLNLSENTIRNTNAAAMKELKFCFAAKNT